MSLIMASKWFLNQSLAIVLDGRKVTGSSHRRGSAVEGADCGVTASAR